MKFKRKKMRTVSIRKFKKFENENKQLWKKVNNWPTPVKWNNNPNIQAFENVSLGECQSSYHHVPWNLKLTLY